MANTYIASDGSQHFKFTNMTEYREQQQPHATYELQHEQGPAGALFKALEITPSNLSLWFESFEGLDTLSAVKAAYLYTNTCEIDEVLEHLSSIDAFEGDVEDTAENEIRARYWNDIPGPIKGHIDFVSFAKDQCWEEFDFDGKTYTIDP